MTHLYRKFILGFFFLLIGFGLWSFLDDSGFFDTLRYGSSTISVTIKETKFEETSLQTTVKKGENVVIVVRNREEGRNHNFLIKALNLDTRVLKPGETDIIEFTPDKSGKYDFLCTLHATKMVGVLEVSVAKE